MGIFFSTTNKLIKKSHFEIFCYAYKTFFFNLKYTMTAWEQMQFIHGGKDKKIEILLRKQNFVAVVVTYINVFKTVHKNFTIY